MVGFARLLGCYIIIIIDVVAWVGLDGPASVLSGGLFPVGANCLYSFCLCVCALRLPSCASMWGVVLGCLSYHLSIACSSSLAFWICVAIVCNVWLFDQYSFLADLLGLLVHFACFCFQDLVACSYLFFSSLLGLPAWSCMPIPCRMIVTHDDVMIEASVLPGCLFLASTARWIQCKYLMSFGPSQMCG